ncbi:MAG: fructose-bisphosphate aldolase class I [Betaproteobacteria bacterium]|nr:fructose-bisphosphate aldolase class I [Betaproteobacteria bacterium]
MNIDELQSVANAIVAQQKGVLAADESNPTIRKRFDSVGVESTEENRRRYREILFTTEGIERYIGGVILYDETLRQGTRDGVPFPTLLAGRGIVPGIKVDQGAKALALHPGEKVTEGLDGLRARLDEYKRLGARFAKWRAVIEVDENTLPSPFGIRSNAHALARYAALCQEAGLVPIVEPEVLMDGAHPIERTEAVTARVLQAVFTELDAHRVLLEGMLLKPNMVIAGKNCPHQAGVQEVAIATLRCLRRHVPAAVPGIVFLSGGQGAADATDHLNGMNAMGPQPWQVSFSYGRALQEPVLAAWRGQEGNAAAAQQAFLKRCRLNGLARSGQYARSMEAEI